MKITLRRLSVTALGFLLLTMLYACLVPDAGYVGGVYVEPGYEYGGWGPRYYVAPPRGGEHRSESRGDERRVEKSSPRAYRPAPPSRPAPSIPTRPRGR
jgi:hypothetical protein